MRKLVGIYVMNAIAAEQFWMNLGIKLLKNMCDRS